MYDAFIATFWFWGGLFAALSLVVLIGMYRDTQPFRRIDPSARIAIGITVIIILGKLT